MSVNLRVLDRAADMLGGATVSYATPGDLARYIDPRTIQTPALDVLDAALVDAANGASPRLIFSMSPQEGKSWRVSRAFPAWVLTRRPNARIAIVSYAVNLARASVRLVRNDIEANPGLGLVVRSDSRAATEWHLEGHDGGMIAAGIGSGLTGRPVDVLIIDDPLKDRQEADSEVYRQRVWDWWTEVGSARLGPGSVVVCVMTRWHEDDLAGRLMEDAPDTWRLINIPAQADHRPEAGEVDVLGRRPGEFMLSARGRTLTEWEDRKRTAGSRTWNALYQGRPSPADGGIFKREWWRFYDTPRAVRGEDGAMRVPGNPVVEIHVDATFKDTKHSDFVVMQVWAQKGPKAWLLDQVRGRMDFTATCDALAALSAKWPDAHTKVIEDKANGPAIISTLRLRMGGIVGCTPRDSKEARASAIAPFVEAGDVELPSPGLAPWVGELIDETLAFPNGAHDDQVDAMSQALHRLLLAPRPRVRVMGNR